MDRGREQESKWVWKKEHVQRDKVIYETTKIVHAFALFGNWAEPFLFFLFISGLALLCIVLFLRCFLFFVSFMAVCSSTEMLKRNSSVGKVYVFFCVFFIAFPQRRREREFQLQFVPVSMPYHAMPLQCFVLVMAILQTIFIVQYTRDPTVTMQQFQWNLFAQNFFGRIEYFSNVRLLLFFGLSSGCCIPFLTYSTTLARSPYISSTVSQNAYGFHLFTAWILLLIMYFLCR